LQKLRFRRHAVSLQLFVPLKRSRGFDFAIINAAYDYEQASRRRQAPDLTPALPLPVTHFRPALP
jgi:hypothetical protein